MTVPFHSHCGTASRASRQLWIRFSKWTNLWSHLKKSLLGIMQWNANATLYRIQGLLQMQATVLLQTLQAISKKLLLPHFCKALFSDSQKICFVFIHSRVLPAFPCNYQRWISEQLKRSMLVFWIFFGTYIEKWLSRRMVVWVWCIAKKLSALEEALWKRWVLEEAG